MNKTINPNQIPEAATKCKDCGLPLSLCSNLVLLSIGKRSIEDIRAEVAAFEIAAYRRGFIDGTDEMQKVIDESRGVEYRRGAEELGEKVKAKSAPMGPGKASVVLEVYIDQALAELLSKETQ